ncbi:MAG: phosphoribosyl-AMP cyclohydrolase [Lachnospiraceae bacterium]|nr:phosphoribosyl-AMP cyclohydrolase [Lachnospiraceae bacterium]
MSMKMMPTSWVDEDREVPVSAIPWSEFKLNKDGLLPVISQDYLTDEVLILAYMNEEAYEMTLRTGKMTYWSRSRQELWTKGATSGHLQYVRSLKLDCDNDTMLAKVIQVGPACHTGSKSCFFKDLHEEAGSEKNTMQVLRDTCDRIARRTADQPETKADSAEAAEVKQEIADDLYLLMARMVENGLSWEDVAGELANR